MDISQIKKYINDEGIQTVEVGFADTCGVLRGKSLPARYFIETGAENGTELAKAPFTWDLQCGLFSGTDLASFDNGFPDMVLKPILETFRKIPWKKNSAFVLCDLFDEHGEPVQVAPREILKKVLKRANDLGYYPKVGAELEFYLLDAQKKPIFDGIQCYSLLRASEHESVLGEMQNSLEEFGIKLEAFHIEFGPGQIEVIPQYDDALRMADNTVLIKNTIKEIARKHGLYATFMAKPWAEESGNGFHVHQSLWDKEGKVNYFGKDEALAVQYLAGLQHTAKDFMVFGAPSVNSYKRFREHSLAPTNVTWGKNNRTVATRALLGGGNGSRLEHRIGSADANPYFIIAANIAAGLYGIEHKLQPADITDQDAYLKETHVLPRNLSQALDYLETNELAREYLGEEFIKLFLVIGRHEVSVYEDAVTDWERERYLEFI